MSNGATPSEAFPSERLADVLDSAPAIVWLWDPEAGCTYVSSAWTRITGRPASDAWGEGWNRSVHPDDEQAFAACRLAMRRNERFAAEYRLRCADGSYATVNDQGYPLESGAGQFLGAALEVTAQREAEALVRASDALLAAVAEGMGAALGVKDRAGRYLIANDAMSELLGVEPGAAIGRTDRDLGIEDWARRDDQDRAVLGGVDVGAEDSHHDATFLTTKSALRGPDDTIEGVIVVGTDISAERGRRARAERLDRVTHALSSSTSVQEVADAVFVEALDALETKFGALGLVQPDGRTIEITRLSGFETKRIAWRSVVIDGDDDSPITLAAREGTSAFYRSTEELLARMPHLRGRLLDYEARAVLPLRSGDEVLGVLYAAFTEPQSFDTDRRAYFLAVADRIAQALERARLFDAARRSDEQTRALQAVTADLGAAMTVEEVQLVTTRSACAAVGADGCLLALVDPGSSVLTYAETDAYPSDLRPLLPTSLDPAASPVADVLASGKTLVFDTGAALVDAYPRLGDLIAAMPFVSRAFVPVGASGAVTGVLIASSATEARFDDDAVRLLEGIAGQCGQALHRAILYRDSRRATDRASALQAATLAIAEATTIGEAVEPAVSFALELVDAEIAALLLVDPESRRLSVAQQIGVPSTLLERWGSVPVDAITVVDHAVESRRGQWRTSEELRTGDPELAADLASIGVGSVGVVPLISGGAVLGILGMGRADAPPDRFVQDTLETFAERVGAAIYRANLLETERRTRHQLERTLSRLSRLQTVSDAISQAVPVEEVTASALDASMEALGALGGAAYVVDGAVLRLIAAEGNFRSAVGDRLDTVPVGADMAMCASFATGTINWLPTYREWKQRYAFGASMFEGVARSTIAIPFSLEGRVLGVMTLVFADENVLDRPERRLARTIGYQAAVALERSQLYEREMARSRRTEQIQHLIAELAGSTDAAGIAAILTSTGMQVLGAAGSAVVLLDEGTEATAEVVAAAGLPPRVLEAIATDERAPGHAALVSGRPSLSRTPNGVRDRYPELADELGAAIAELPMLTGGATLGALIVCFATPQQFDLEQIDLLAAVASEAAQAIARARVHRREREISRILQQSLLPEKPTASWNGARVNSWYSAGTEHLDVGGDWYDAIELPNGRLGVSIGDVVGRGLRAAAAMGQLRSALRGIALEMRGPAATLEALNRFATRTPGTELATVAYAEYDAMTGAFVYACAGHPPPVGCIGGRTVVFEGGRSPLLAAGYEGPRAEASAVLPPDSTLVLYTDGLIERRDEPFHRGVDRLRKAIEGGRDLEPAALVDTVVDAVLGDRERTDDAALLVLRTGDPIPFAMTLDDTPEGLRPMRHRLHAWLDLRGCTPDDADAVVLAVNEAAANAIEHGYQGGGGPVEVAGDVVGGDLRISVVDHGDWRAAHPDPARGRGLPLMRTLMDEVEIERLDPGTRIVLKRKVNVAAGAPALAGSDGRV